MKKYLLLIIIILCVATYVIIDKKTEITGLFKTMSSEDLQASIEIVDVETKWVDKYYQPWPPRLILVPAISFKVKNLTDKPLRYINFNAIFKEKDARDNLGDNYMAAIRKDPIPPSETSSEIVLKSNFGVEGKSLASFKSNPQWKLYTVTLFAQSKGSQFVNFGDWQISRKIDFKEPEPVGMEEKKEEKK